MLGFCLHCWLPHSLISLALRRLKEEGHEFKVSTDYTVKPCLKKQAKIKMRYSIAYIL